MTESGSDWVPLSVRRGLRQAGELHVGVPEHLHRPLAYWFQGILGYRDTQGMKEGRIHSIATRVGIKLYTSRPVDMMNELIEAGEHDEDMYLDIIDAALATGRGNPSGLKRILEEGRSVWTVSEDEIGLIQRVDATASESYLLASRPDDVASEELSEAWTNVYGREPDPSDAWDHAIKATEAVLIPTVVPDQDKPTLGHVIGTLTSQGERFAMKLDNGDSIPTLVSMLRLLWPNPDRHANPEQRRTPSEEEARAVVHLAVTVVQWSREGLISRLRA